MTDERRGTDGDDDTIARPFDQTNGMIDTAGESDGTAQSDTTSPAERPDADDGLDGAVVGDDRERGVDEEDLGFGGGAAASPGHHGS